MAAESDNKGKEAAKESRNFRFPACIKPFDTNLFRVFSFFLRLVQLFERRLAPAVAKDKLSESPGIWRKLNWETTTWYRGEMAGKTVQLGPLTSEKSHLRQAPRSASMKSIVSCHQKLAKVDVSDIENWTE
jgi:hypothetical protein